MYFPSETYLFCPIRPFWHAYLFQRLRNPRVDSAWGRDRMRVFGSCEATALPAAPLCCPICWCTLGGPLRLLFPIDSNLNLFLSLTFYPVVFLTGSDRIPIYGMSSIRMTIQPTAGGDCYLPVAHTCYNLLDLPKYQTKAKLCTKLTQAIDHHEGFSLVWDELFYFPFQYKGIYRSNKHFIIIKDYFTKFSLVPSCFKRFFL